MASSPAPTTPWTGSSTTPSGHRRPRRSSRRPVPCWPGGAGTTSRAGDSAEGRGSSGATGRDQCSCSPTRPPSDLDDPLLIFVSSGIHDAVATTLAWPRAQGGGLPAAEAQERLRSGLAEEIGADGRALLDKIDTDPVAGWMHDLPQVQVLRTMWAHHYDQTSTGRLRWKDTTQLPPAAERSPHRGPRP